MSAANCIRNRHVNDQENGERIGLVNAFRKSLEETSGTSKSEMWSRDRMYGSAANEGWGRTHRVRSRCHRPLRRRRQSDHMVGRCLEHERGSNAQGSELVAA